MSTTIIANNVPVIPNDGTNSIEILDVAQKKYLRDVGSGHTLLHESWQGSNTDLDYTKWQTTVSGNASFGITNRIMTLSVTDDGDIFVLKNRDFIDFFAGHTETVANMWVKTSAPSSTNTRYFGILNHDYSEGAYFEIAGTTIYATNSVNGNKTQTDITSYFSANTWQRYSISTSLEGTKFYVNDIKVASFDPSHIETSSQTNFYFKTINSGAANSIDFQIGHIYAVQAGNSAVSIVDVAGQNRHWLINNRGAGFITTSSSKEVIEDEFRWSPLRNSTWKIETGTDYSVSSDKLNLTNGSLDNQTTKIVSVRSLSYGTFNLFDVTESSRRNNTGFFIDLIDKEEGSSDTDRCCIRLGFNVQPSTLTPLATSDASTIIRVNSSNDGVWGDDEQISLPFSEETSSSHNYSFYVSPEAISLVIDQALIWTRNIHLPELSSPNESLSIQLGAITGTGIPAGSSSFSINRIVAYSEEPLAISAKFPDNPLKTRYADDVDYISGYLNSLSTSTNQVVCQYTVPARKVAYIAGWEISASGIPEDSLVKIGKNNLSEPSSGSSIINGELLAFLKYHDENERIDYSIPRRIAQAGDIIKIAVSPNSASSTHWYGNLSIILR